MDKTTYFHRVHRLSATRFWINNVTRQEAQQSLEAGAVGCTQNPSYTWKMMSDENEKPYVMKKLDAVLKLEKDDDEALVALQRDLVSSVAEYFLPLFQESCGKYGYVSIQGDPFREDTETILRHARFNCEAGENIMAKIPVTKEGLEAIEVLIEEGVPINATEVMSVKQAMDVCEIYEKVTRGMKHPAPIYFSHIAGIYDEYIAGEVKEKNIDIESDYLYQAGISVAKKIYAMVREKNCNVGFISGGARGLHHFTEMVGADCCITINWKGAAEDLIKQNPMVLQRFLQPVPDSVTDTLLEKLETHRKAYMLNEISAEEYEDFGPVVLFRTNFEEAWGQALEAVKQRRP